MFCISQKVWSASSSYNKQKERAWLRDIWLYLLIVAFKKYHVGWKGRENVKTWRGIKSNGLGLVQKVGLLSAFNGSIILASAQVWAYNTSSWLIFKLLLRI